MKSRHPSLLAKRFWPLAAILLTFSLPSARGVEVVLTEDSTIYSGSVASTQGISGNLVVNTTTTKCGVLRFDLTNLPTDVTAADVASAHLRVFSTVAPTGTGTVSIYKIATGRSWTEDNAAGVWAADTDYDSNAVLSSVSVDAFGLNQYTALEVTDAVKSWITTPSSNNGLIIRPSVTAIGLTLATKENTSGGHNAVLEITLRSHKWLSGTTDPTSSTGQDGDWYLNTATSTYFGPKYTIPGTPPVPTWPAGISIKGATGSPGANGSNGTNGANGNSVLSGTGTPGAGVGVNGDYFLNTASNLLFGPKTAGAWGAAVSLVGPQGLQGPQGPQGLQGPQGIQGPVGPATLRVSAQGDLLMGGFSNGTPP